MKTIEDLKFFIQQEILKSNIELLKMLKEELYFEGLHEAGSKHGKHFGMTMVSVQEEQYKNTIERLTGETK